MSQNRYIISVGGSLIVPDEINVDFLKKFKRLLASRKRDLFILAPGGGKTSRRYSDAARKIGDLNRNDLDWLGIYAIKLNSLLLTSIFKTVKNVKVMKMVEAHPGRSSDYDSVIFARRFKVKEIINLSNIDYVYNKDPKRFKDAKPIKQISWRDFRKIVGDKWDPGLNAPFDPVASKLAEKLKLKVIVMNGKKLENLKDFLSGKKFNGTVIG